MKKLLTALVVVVWALSPEVWATAVGTGAVKQPMNMGPESDPKRIPVGWVPCESNHGYGTIELISTPFPMMHGGWRWDGGIELNGNLPSAFGISVEPEDTTNLPHSPVVIRVRKQTPPRYSPYTKEQVLLATLRCLMDSVRSTELRPLKVTVKVEDPKDEALKRFSKDYVTQQMGEVEFEPTPLPGVSKEVTPGGMEMIVFDAVADVEDAPATAEPVWVPFPLEGEMVAGYLVLPAWKGNTHEAELLGSLGRPWPVLQDRFDPSTGNPDANLMTRSGKIGHFGVQRAEDAVYIHVDVHASQDVATRRDLAAVCWATVLSERPKGGKPLIISLELHEPVAEAFQEWIKEGWEVSKSGNDLPMLSGTFVWDVEKGVLTKGKIPDLAVRPGLSGGWVLSDKAEEVEIP